MSPRTRHPCGPKPMKTPDRQRLRALAERALSGASIVRRATYRGMDLGMVEITMNPANAEYVQEARPDVLLSLLDRLDELDVAARLLSDVLAQACMSNGRVYHQFISSYEDAFSFFGITEAQISEAQYEQAVAAKLDPPKEPTP